MITQEATTRIKRIERFTAHAEEMVPLVGKITANAVLKPCTVARWSIAP